MKPYEDGDEKKSQVRRMFDRIAPTYDLLNHLLSFGVDRSWRRRVVRLAAEEAPLRVLDVACGTGDMAVGLARMSPHVRVTGIDLSPGMIEGARSKIARLALEGRIELKVGDAEALEDSERGFDAATVAFGVRNFQDIPRGLESIGRTLRPGGRLFVLEFSTPDNRLFGAFYRFYFHRVLPVVGGWLSRDRKAYDYLPRSVDEFPGPAEFLGLMREAGYADCRAEALWFGVARIFTGVKP